jgi:intracellular sulfur oxidation DsrE/DsrF family protein
MIMNQFYFESRGKEKVRELLNEGVTSQLHHRSLVRKSLFSQGLVKLIVIVLSILGIAELLVH